LAANPDANPDLVAIARRIRLEFRPNRRYILTVSSIPEEGRVAWSADTVTLFPQTRLGRPIQGEPPIEIRRFGAWLEAVIDGERVALQPESR
jgi:hypothetical protein